MTTLTRRTFLGVGLTGIITARHALGDTNAPPDTFTFAALNDTHVKDPSSTAIVERAAEYLNEDERIQFVVVLGDIGTDGTPEEMRLSKQALDRIAHPWFALPGNHDVAMNDRDIYENFKAAFGPVHWTHEQQGWRFIGFNSCEDAKSHVTVADAELQWLREQAGHIEPDQPVALFCHHPLNPNTSNYRILNADAVLDIFEGHALRIVAAGHWHGNQLETQHNTLFTTTACCATTRGNFDNTEERGYRLFHLQGDQVTTEFVEVLL